ncbi:FxSxx-COOH system tetratricopeptide repeat protein [Actinomadura bangladeshensis]|uniref:Tetratricopeptide repeat protein n=1 Tax=Actinomadura bangladeshensis TaxID=453573 RepID=A0A4R4PBC7_9ACTN|nr:FxSxx-COOH system tetratricopeptide repeat protein [Actinomadura bangladeshensis]TDC19695.1 tetratricopeptide repeat protein [Actinomadura bangladeshensis]
MSGQEAAAAALEKRVPPVWGNVPPRNKNFTGREELLAALREGIAEKVTAVVPQPQALHGLGGVGKTLMSVEYIYRYRHTYDVVWWIPSDQPFLVKTALADLAPHLGLRSAAVSGIEEAAREVLDALRRGEPYQRWLLVFDNADQPEDLFDIIPQGPGHVLITSRNHRWASMVDAVPVDVFSREESVEFLLKRVRAGITGEDAGRLAEQLGDLPLALEQAGALLFERGMTVPEYLEQLEERTSQLLSQGRPAEYPVPMTAAWSVSVANLSESLPEAVDLLRVCAFFGSEPIPREVIGRAPDGLRPQLAGLIGDTIRLGRAVGELGRYALARLDINARTIEVHRLVQRLVQDELSPEEQRRIRHEVHLLLAAYDAGDPYDEETWPKYGALSGHLTPAGIAGCEAPEVRAFAIRMLRYMFGSGDYDSARKTAENFIEKWGADSGPEHPDVIRMKLELTNTLREVGEYDTATELNDEILAAAEKVLGRDDPDTLRSLRGSAADLRAAGDFREALKRDEEALRRFEDRYGPEHAGTLRAVNNLALDYGLLSDYGKARELHDRSYSGWRDRGAKMVRASVVAAVSGLARAVRLSGGYSEACDLGFDAYAMGQESLGAEHNWTLRTGKDLSIALRRYGEFDQAEELATQVQERCVRLLGPNSPDTLAAAVCLANLWRTTDRLDEAAELVADSASRYAEVLRPDHPYTLACLTNLAVLRRIQGDAVAARKLNERALAGLDARLGRDHDYSLTVAVNLATDLVALGDLEAACRLGEGTLRRLRALFGDLHPLTLTGGANLAADLKAAGRTEEAAELAERIRTGYRRTLGLNHPDAVVFEEGRHLDADFDAPPI